MPFKENKTLGTGGKLSVLKLVMCICVLDIWEERLSLNLCQIKPVQQIHVYLFSKSAWWSLVSRIAVPFVIALSTVVLGTSPSQ